MAGWRWLAAALASMALAFLAALTLAGVALADGDEQEAAARAALQPTQVVAEIPDGYNQLFPLQWGGGSLYQLKARLGTMGCLANTIWNYDGGEWHGYNQYHVPSTLNAEWLGAYQEFVPAGSLYATCFDVCTFSYFDAPRPADTPCLSPVAWLEANGASYYRHPIDESSTCTDDFDPLVKQSALPSMPLYPDTCLVRQERPLFGGQATFPFTLWNSNSIIYPYYPNVLVIYGPRSEDPHYRTYARNVELHELCHANQDFHIAEQMQPDRLLNPLADVSYSDDWDVTSWLVTEPGRAFVDLVGFAREADGDWSLPDDTYESIYGPDPVELAAELCSFYLLDRMGEQISNVFSDPDFDLARYLTPEIVEWIEMWVALPEIAAHATD